MVFTLVPPFNPSISALNCSGVLCLFAAPDVALAEAAVGAILTPIIFMITLKKVKNKKLKEEEECVKK